MKSGKPIKILIRPVENRKGSYIASFHSEFLNATFSVCFQDTITGSLALWHFSEMIRKKYEQEIELVLMKDQLAFKNEAVLDVVKSSSAFHKERIVPMRF